MAGQTAGPLMAGRRLVAGRGGWGADGRLGRWWPAGGWSPGGRLGRWQPGGRQEQGRRPRRRGPG